ncbi:hypothetical protein [Rubritalea sp.]|uniref:hypothetical protein n=1 Tax=Rubritalea sp. TaxID=2109375 RepID=UPI003EF8B05A
MKLRLGLICATFCASALSSQAEVLVQYVFTAPAEYKLISGDASSARVTWNASTTAAGTRSSVFQGVGLQLFTKGDIHSSFTSAAGSAAEKANAGDYEMFTLTAGSGKKLDLASLTFDVITNSNNDNTYSVDVLLDGGPAKTLVATNNNITSYDLDLSGFANAGELEVRINIDAFTGGHMQIDNVIVNGDVVEAPETRSAALLGFGDLTLTLSRSR